MARDNGKPKGDGFNLVVENRKARHDFFIEETLEAGLALTGTEVKSLRAHRANLRDSYARIKNGEAFLEGVHIGAYAPAGQFSHKETRPRKLLMHRREVVKRRRLDRESARFGEGSLLVEKKSAVQRIQNEDHKARRAEEASSYVHHVAAGGRLRGNRDLELCVEQMFAYDRAPKLLRIMGDLRLESGDGGGRIEKRAAYVNLAGVNLDVKSERMA